MKYKYRHDNKKYETCGIKHKDWDCFLEYKHFKDHLIEQKCSFYNCSNSQNIWD